MRRPTRSLPVLAVVLALLAAAPGLPASPASPLLPTPRVSAEAVAAPPDLTDPIGAALAAFDANLALAGADVAHPLASLHAQERANLLTGRALIEIDGGSSLDRAVEAAAILTRHHLALLGDSADGVPMGPLHERPSDALLALIPDAGATLDAPVRASISALDALPPPVGAALTRTLDAYGAFDRATVAGFRGGDGDALLNAASEGIPAGPAFRDAGFALGPVLAARLALLDASRALHDALEAEPAAASAAPLLDLRPHVLIDLSAEGNVYTAGMDVHLLIDAGGNDVYFNNGGGNGLFGRCSTSSNPLSAALIDLGGDDQHPTRRGCGANGGATWGSGFLFDAAGSDTYYGGLLAVNGGAFIGTGFLLDGDGRDHYNGTDSAANGGGYGGLGLLVDGDGNDRYWGFRYAVNGGGYRQGLGALLDLGGFDRFNAYHLGTNGGAAQIGAGYLFKTGGASDMRGLGDGTNGGAYAGSVGFLLAASGHDFYFTDRNGGNGGAYAQSVGMLLDTGGNDVYLATIVGVNGAGIGIASGNLLDLDGHDRYVATGDFANGAATYGTGLLFDAYGNDTYHHVRGLGNGAGNGDPLVEGTPPPQVARLIDLGGRDTYIVDKVITYDETIDPKGQGGAQLDYDYTTDL